MILNEVLLKLPPLGFTPVNGAVVERQKAPLHGSVVHSEGAAGFELGIIAVLGGRIQVLGGHALVIFVLEPLIRNSTIAKILIDMGASVDDADNAVLLEKLGTESTPAGPGIHRRQCAFADRGGGDGPEIAVPGCRAHRQHPRVVFVAAAKGRQCFFHYGIDPFWTFFPNALR